VSDRFHSHRLWGAGASVAVVALVAMANPGAAILAKKSAHSSHVASCTPADLSATLSLTPVGGSSSSLAGAIVFADATSRSCSLRGVPKVRVAGPSGLAIPVSQAPNFARHLRAVTLAPSPSSGSQPDAGVSITWSDWTCAKGSFALDVQYPGWSGPMTLPWGTTTGYAGSPCAVAQATLYVGPTAKAASPA
jgi:hypothetical protein